MIKEAEKCVKNEILPQAKILYQGFKERNHLGGFKQCKKVTGSTEKKSHFFQKEKKFLAALSNIRSVTSALNTKKPGSYACTLTFKKHTGCYLALKQKGEKTNRAFMAIGITKPQIITMYPIAPE